MFQLLYKAFFRLKLSNYFLIIFYIIKVGLGTYYPWIREHTCIYRAFRSIENTNISFIANRSVEIYAWLIHP
jgi:hypothetical protein